MKNKCPLSGEFANESNYNNNINNNNNHHSPEDADRRGKGKGGGKGVYSARDGVLTGKLINSYGATETTDGKRSANITVADIIGSFGWFQFVVLLFSGLRESSVGYDAVVMSIILQPETNLLCADNLSSNWSQWNNLAKFEPNNKSASDQYFNETEHCYQSLGGEILHDPETGQPIKCESWIFPPSNESASLVAEWSLVCDRHWLIAFIESAFFMGLVTGNLAWGYYADRAGRRRAYLVAHTVALIAGWASIFVTNVSLFTLCRFFTAFGTIGYNIIYSIQVELIGTRHRSFSTTLNHLGWGLGVCCVPLFDYLFTDYRYIIAVAPVLTLVMFPFAFWLPESSRWLMTSGQIEPARRELIRAAKFNGKILGPALDKKIDLLALQISTDVEEQNNKINCGTNPIGKQCNGVVTKQSAYKLLLANPPLMRDTLILASTTFTGHLFYYMLTINFAYMKNLSIEANFIISGAGEWVSVVAGATMLKFCTRKTCMSIFLLLMSLSFALQCLIDSHLVACLDIPVVVTLNNGIGTLSSLLLIFIVLIVNQEVYPTVMRQTGSSIVNTIGEVGSTFAPVLISFSRIIGLWRIDLACSFYCLLGIVGIQFLTETDNIELHDT